MLWSSSLSVENSCQDSFWLPFLMISTLICFLYFYYWTTFALPHPLSDCCFNSTVPPLCLIAFCKDYLRNASFLKNWPLFFTRFCFVQGQSLIPIVVNFSLLSSSSSFNVPNLIMHPQFAVSFILYYSKICQGK